LSPRLGAPPPLRLLVPAFLALGLAVFGPALLGAPRHRSDDWGPHHDLTRALARGLQAGHVPRYLIGVSTGDSPFETYPFPAYAAAALLTLATGDLGNAPAALALLGLLAHAGLAALVARLAARLAPAPIAVGFGVLALLDVGSFASGAGASVLQVGLLHAALAQCLALLALDGVLAILAGGARPGRVAALWASAFLATATHPGGLLQLAPFAPALLLVAACARDTRPRRALLALLHLAIGVLAGAIVWAPFTERMLRHGLHLASPAPSLSAALLELAALREPATSWPAALAAGLLGLGAALLRRRAAALTLAAAAVLSLLGWTELPHRLWFDWLPLTLARWQCFRFLTLARPLLFVCAAYAAGLGWRYLTRRFPPLARGPAAVALPVAALLALSGPGPNELFSLVRSGVPDPEGFGQLVAWAARERAAVPPGRMARALWDGPEHAGHHLAAESGLPVFALGEAVGLMLRERIEDRSSESLRRFNVRWVVFRERAQWLGDAKGEQRFGGYTVRELPEWDGRLARIESGAGEVEVTRLEDERIDVDLGGTEAPALVALGLGYYPRWRARGPDGRALPVFALPATPQSSTRVVGAWLPPGTTTFTADGPLSSDRAGVPFAWVALGLAGLAVALSRPKLACRLVPLLRPRRLRLLAAAVLFAAVGGALVLAGLRRPVDSALALVPGWRPEAQVEARAPGGEWSTCTFSALRRDFECGPLGRLSHATAFAVRDHLASTAYLTPAILARPAQHRVDFRVRATRALEGAYRGAAWGPGGATLLCGGSPAELTRVPTVLSFASPAEPVSCELVLRTRGGNPQGATLVRQLALDLDRTRDVPLPPLTPPPLR
jgi:hypothetical protein